MKHKWTDDHLDRRYRAGMDDGDFCELSLNGEWKPVVGHQGPAKREMLRLAERVELLERAGAAQRDEIEQILGKALRYPAYADDQKNFPGATEADGVCVGEHIAETLAEEAAKRIVELEKRILEMVDAAASAKALIRHEPWSPLMERLDDLLEEIL